jgi:hypothetical protein
VQLEYPVTLTLNYQYVGGGLNSFTFNNAPNNTQGTLFVPAFITELTITGKSASRNGVVLSGASINCVPSNPIISWSSQADYSSKSLDISVSDVSLVTQTFTLAIVKQDVAQTAMASGGNTAFITNTDGSVDELHTFNYDPLNDTNGQTSYTFNMNRGAGLTGRMLVVAGGGGGGAGKSGDVCAASGGGAGKLIYGANWTIQAGAHEIKVGAGGPGTAAGTNSSTTNNGKDSTVKIGNDTLTAPGGGAGSSHWGSNGFTGKSGGSGGGSTDDNQTSGGAVAAATIPSSFSGFTAYGNSGGAGVNYSGSGGGGAGGAGTKGVNSGKSGNGGAGKEFDISGASVGYAGGGGGGAYNGNSSYAGVGYAGGGGWAANAVSGTGSGGGGGGYTTGKIAGGNGGSGIVIIRFPWSKP